MSVNPISPALFNGGQLTDLPPFTGTLNGDEIMEIVAALVGQSLDADGVNYQIKTALLAQLMINIANQQVVIQQGQFTTALNPYVVPTAMGRIFVNKPIAEPTFIQFAEAKLYPIEPLVKDVAGTAAAGNAITMTFFGGETADGIATIPIQTPYGGYIFRPVTALDNWTLGSA